MRIRNFILVALGGVASVLLPGFDPAMAASPCLGSSPRLQMCKRCTTVQIRGTRRDTPCSGNFDPSALADGYAMIIIGTSVAKQPLHGRLQASEGGNWIYTPAKGFVGDDVGTIERDFILRDKELFVTYSEIHMTVSP